MQGEQGKEKNHVNLMMLQERFVFAYISLK